MEVSNEFILQAHKSACSEWKLKIEKECPELFKKELEVGRWYKWNYDNSLLYFTNIKDDKVYYYGFFDGEYIEKDWIHKDNDFTLAEPQEIESALRDEAVRRGFKDGVKIKNHQGTFVLNDLNITYNDKYNDGIFTRQEGGIWLFINGIWSTILEPTEKERLQKKIEKLTKRLNELK